MLQPIISRLALHGICWAWATIAMASIAGADEPQRSPREWLDSFSQVWRDADWAQQGAGTMRPPDDAGWQARMRAVQGFTQQPDAARTLLLETLRTGEPPQRILAAQALGYLGERVPAEPLISTLKTDGNAAVRLYLVDSLGMLGHAERVDWTEYLKGESNRDVKRHVAYVQERAGKPIDPKIVEQLRGWDSRRMKTATLNAPAPDFELSSAQGGRVRLSDFRGTKAVVLVFIYGDT